MDGTLPWSLNESNLTSLITNPTAYLTPLLQNASGEWLLDRVLDSGQSLFYYLAQRIPSATLLPTDHHRAGQIEIFIPLKTDMEGARIYVHPEGYVEVVLEKYPLGKSALDLTMGIDFAGMDAQLGTDNLALFVDSKLHLTSRQRGMMANSYFHLLHDETNNTLPTTVDLFLPNMGKVISPLYELNQSPAGEESLWISSPTSLRLFPVPNVGTQPLGDYLSNTSPMMIVEDLVKVAIDAYLLSKLEGDGLLGEVLEVLDLVKQEKDGRYTCESLLDFIKKPKQYLQSQFMSGSGMNVAKLIQLGEAVLRFVNFPVENILDANNEIIGIKYLVYKKDGSTFAELALQVYADSQGNLNPNGLMVSFSSSSQQNSLPLVYGFNLQANLLPGPVFNFDGTGASITAYPDIILSEVGNISTVFPSGSLIGLSSTFNQGVLSLGLDVNIDGVNTAHLDLLPNLSGTQNFFATLLQSTTGSVLPNLLTLLMRELTSVTFGNQNQHNLGLLLIGFFHDIDLWGPNADQTGSFIPNKVAAIASDPGRWLTGPGTDGSDGWLFNEAQLENVIIGGIRVGCVMMSSKLSYSNHTTGGDDYIEITLQSFSPTLTLDIGKKANGDFGIWLNAGEILTYGTPPNEMGIDIGFTAACLFNLIGTFSIEPSVSLHVLSSQPFADESTLRLKPGLLGSWNLVDGFVVEATTDVFDNGTITDGSKQGSGKGFWIRYESNGNQHWKGMPDLDDLLAGALDIALGFIEGVDKVQDWLKTPLLYSTTTTTPLANPPDWYDPNSAVHQQIVVALQDVSTPGKLADALDLMKEVNGDYAFEDVQSIADDWKSDPLGQILDAVFRLIELSIGEDGELPIYQKTEGDFRFTIKLVDSNPSDNNGSFGLAIEFEEPPEIEMGNLRLQLFTQDPNTWVNAKNPGSEKVYHTGVAFYFADWIKNDPNPITPNLSIELGGLGFRLYRGDGKPLLEKMLLLNQVEMAFCLDVNIEPSSPTEFGGILVLDDFGIELGGGDSDGGNGMAKGLLSGGEDGKDAVKPIFDIAVSKYNGFDMDVSIRGGTEFWFPINKQFGPVNVSEVGVRYEEDPSFENPHRLSILLDANAEISGFYAACDDLGVNIPILKPFAFDDWGFELKGLAIKMDKGKLKIAGALAKQEDFAYFQDPMNNVENATRTFPSGAKAWVDGVEVDADWAIPYVEYQGLCSIITPAFGISAIGAFARVPKGDGTGFVSCFIIAALDMPLGGPPFFFINGLVGGLGLNRDLTLPSIDEVENHLLIQSLGGFSDPMDALASIKPQFPVKYGSFWFALGLKFKTVEIMETRAVLFARFGDDFTIGLLGLSTMDLPKPSIRIAHIELAILAYYDSGENVLWVQAQLTDDSYLFDETCRLTGGFALVTWFNTGEFVISLGGYHPNFNVPDYYPVVPRLGFNWKPTSTLTVKGGVYFTLCSRAVMLGGRLDASFKKGKIKASFVAGMDALVQFDPFHYEFDIYINLSIKVGRLKAGIGADLHIEGPRMHGIAQLEVLFVKFKVKFGNNDSPPSELTVREFLHKHIRQLSSGSPMAVSSWLNSEEAHATTVVEGIIRSKEQDESNMGSDINPYLVGPEFSLSLLSKFPSKESNFLKSRYTQGRDPSGALKTASSVVLFPVSKKAITPVTTIRLFNLDTNSELEDAIDGMDFIPTLGGFASSTWSTEGKTSTVGSKFFINGGLMKATTTFEDGGQCIAFEGNIEPCEMNMHLPLQEDESALVSMIDDLNTITLDLSKSPMALIESIITDEKVSVNARAFKTEVEKKGSFRRDVL